MRFLAKLKTTPKRSNPPHNPRVLHKSVINVTHDVLNWSTFRRAKHDSLGKQCNLIARGCATVTKKFSNVISFNQERARAQSHDDRLLERAREIMLTKTNQLFAKMFERVQDLLFNLADKAKDGQERVQFFDALRSVRLRRAAVEAQFSAALAANLARAERSGLEPSRTELVNNTASVQSPDDADCLTELSDEQIAALVSLSTLSEKSKQLLHTELSRIQLQLNTLLKANTAGDAEQTLGPALVCDAFRQAVLVIEPPLPGEVRRILFTVFDRFVLKQLGAIYQDIGEQLAKPAETMAAPASAPTRGRAYEESNSAPSYHLSQLLAALHRWQHENHASSLAETNHSEHQSALKHFLTETLSTQLGRPVALKPLDADTIDTAAILIENVVENTTLAKSMKALLTQLATPLIKVALVDTVFFATENHPARRLLADLAQAAASRTTQSDYTTDPIYAQMQTIVSTLREETDVNITVFYELQEDFDKFLAATGVTSVVPPEASYATQQRVRAAIEQPISKQSVPQPVIDFLRGPWHAALNKIAEEDGCQGIAWHTGVRVVDQLLWSVSPKHSAGERKLCADLIPRLLSDIKEGLAVIAWDHHQKNNFHAELEALHLTALRPAVVKQRFAPSLSKAVAQNDVAPTEITLASDQNKKHVDVFSQSDKKVAALNQFANELPLGTWLDLADDNFRESRVKLAWKDEILQTLTFVNRRVQVVAEVTLSDLANKFAEGKARIVEDVPLVDRALDAIANRLTRK